jgi:F0F1-type ATP synthase membrane subunit c/vacuolar-type H+-ATPase subunit K
VKNKVETIGSGVAKKKILGQGIKKVAKKPRKRKGGALFPAGNYGPRD